MRRERFQRGLPQRATIITAPVSRSIEFPAPFRTPPPYLPTVGGFFPHPHPTHRLCSEVFCFGFVFVGWSRLADMGHRGAGAVSRGLVGIGVLPRGERGLVGVRCGMRGFVRAGGDVMPCHVMSCHVLLGGRTRTRPYLQDDPPPKKSLDTRVC